MSKAAALPASWIRTVLGEAVEYGTTIKAEPSEIADGEWVLELEDIEKDTSKLLARITFAKRKSKSTKNRFSTGDVLYGKLRPYLNKVLIADKDGVCTTEIVPIKPNPVVNGRYLYHWLRHPEFLEYVTNVSHGLNMPRLGTDAGRNAPFILAPAAEQKRIADKLDAVLAKVGACRDRLYRVPRILERFREATLEAAVSGRLTQKWREVQNSSPRLSPYEVSDSPVGAPQLPASWRWVSIGTLAEKVVDGVHKKPHYVDTGIPFVTVKNLTAGPGIDFSDTRFISEADHEEFCRRTRPERGDLLVSKDGTLGVIRLIETDRPFSIFVSVALIKLRDKRLAPYMKFALEAPMVQAQMVGVGTGLQHIHLQDLRQDVVPIPPPEEQVEIVRCIDRLFTLSDSLEQRYRDAASRVERLTPSVLAKAFRGALVPQNPNDEPAETLLERIISDGLLPHGVARAPRGRGSRAPKTPQCR